MIEVKYKKLGIRIPKDTEIKDDSEAVKLDEILFQELLRRDIEYMDSVFVKNLKKEED